MRVRVWDDSDYARVRCACDAQEGWAPVYRKGNTVISVQSTSGSQLHMVRARTIYPDVPPSLVYDVLHDDAFRKHWDRHMQASKDIGLINPNNDLCYYSLKAVPPVRPRDFVLQRSWLDTGHEKLICSHSVCHDDYPPQKGFIRATVFVSGYLIRPHGDGCELIYVTHSDPGGKLPVWLINRATKVMAPKILHKLHKACLTYSKWKAENRPNWKPWIFVEQTALFPRIDIAKCEPREYTREIVDESTAGETIEDSD